MREKATSFGCSLGGCVIYLLVLFLPGWWSVNFITNVVFCKDAPWWADALVGLFVSGITVPVALIVWFLRLLGVDVAWGCH